MVMILGNINKQCNFLSVDEPTGGTVSYPADYVWRKHLLLNA